MTMEGLIAEQRRQENSALRAAVDAMKVARPQLNRAEIDGMVAILAGDHEATETAIERALDPILCSRCEGSGHEYHAVLEEHIRCRNCGGDGVEPS